MENPEYLCKEYDRIQEEIMHKLELHNSLLTFTITTSVALMTLAITQQSTILYLMPFCILIPMSLRISYYRFATAKLAGYLIVFVEPHLPGIQWETINADLMSQNLKNKKSGKESFKILHYDECLVLCVISYLLFLTNYVKGKTLDMQVTLCALAPFSLVILEYFITRKINCIDSDRVEWIRRWEAIKKEANKKSPGGQREQAPH